MNTHTQIRQDKGVSQEELDSNGKLNKHKTLVYSTADFYTEWTSEKTPAEKPKSEGFANSVELPSGKEYLSHNIHSKYKRVSGNAETDDSTCYNEIYNRPELFIFSRT